MQALTDTLAEKHGAKVDDLDGVPVSAKVMICDQLID
jgi:hypothetical protein